MLSLAADGSGHLSRSRHYFLAYKKSIRDGSRTRASTSTTATQILYRPRRFAGVQTDLQSIVDADADLIRERTRSFDRTSTCSSRSSTAGRRRTENNLKDHAIVPLSEADSRTLPPRPRGSAEQPHRTGAEAGVYDPKLSSIPMSDRSRRSAATAFMPACAPPYDLSRQAAFTPRRHCSDGVDRSITPPVHPPRSSSRILPVTTLFAPITTLLPMREPGQYQRPVPSHDPRSDAHRPLGLHLLGIGQGPDRRPRGSGLVMLHVVAGPHVVAGLDRQVTDDPAAPTDQASSHRSTRPERSHVLPRSIPADGATYEPIIVSSPMRMGSFMSSPTEADDARHDRSSTGEQTGPGAIVAVHRRCGRRVVDFDRLAQFADGWFCSDSRARPRRSRWGSAAGTRSARFSLHPRRAHGRASTFATVVVCGHPRSVPSRFVDRRAPASRRHLRRRRRRWRPARRGHRPGGVVAGIDVRGGGPGTPKPMPSTRATSSITSMACSHRRERLWAGRRRRCRVAPRTPRAGGAGRPGSPRDRARRARRCHLRPRSWWPVRQPSGCLVRRAGGPSGETVPPPADRSEPVRVPGRVACRVASAWHRPGCSSEVRPSASPPSPS